MAKSKTKTEMKLAAEVRRSQYAARKAKADAEAAAWRTVEASYKGGVPTRTSEPWSVNLGYRFGTFQERSQIISARDRAYHAYKNNPVAKSLINTEADNVIGDGLNYQPTTSSEEFNKEAKDKYYEWLQVASLRGPDTHPGCELESMLWKRSRIAGDIGWILVSRGAESRIQVVQAQNISTPDGKSVNDGIYDGIKYDQSATPQTFFVLTQTEITKRQWAEIPARDFVYLHHMEDPDGARGETCFMPIFDLLAHLDRYVDGVSLAAWLATVIGLIFKQKNPARQFSALSTMPNSQGEEQKSIIFENGMFKILGTDEDVTTVNPHQPMQQTPEFIRTLMRCISQVFDMPLAISFKDTSQENFASARIGLLPFYRACRIKAARFASRWSRTIGWWLSRERFRAPGDPRRWKSEFPEDYRKHDLIVNSWTYTDPVKEAQGDLLEMSMRTKSPQMVIEERGRDAQKIIADWKAWEAMLGDMPQVLSSMTRDPMEEPVEEETEPKGESESDNGNGEYATNLRI